MRNNVSSETHALNAKEYTEVVTEKTFSAAIVTLFNKIYTR